jgi:Ca2+-binding EF-hand superfamily protein
MSDTYQKFFDDADKDKSGFLSQEELVAALRKNGYKGTDDQIKAMFNSVDFSGDNKISLDEYLAAMGQVPPKEHKAATMRSLFRSFDKDGSGSIDRSELDAVFKEMGKSFTDDELKRMIQLADKDATGTLEYEEFIGYVFG